jgi:hypothetical protein
VVWSFDWYDEHYPNGVAPERGSKLSRGRDNLTLAIEARQRVRRPISGKDVLVTEFVNRESWSSTNMAILVQGFS